MYGTCGKLAGGTLSPALMVMVHRGECLVIPRPLMMLALPDIQLGHGSGSSLPLPVLALAGVSTLVAVVVSGISIWLQLTNYRKPLLQRYPLISSYTFSLDAHCPLCSMVVRIMVMVPLYGVASFISLFSLEAAFFIDVIRDIYEVPPVVRPSFALFAHQVYLGLCYILFLCPPSRLSGRRALAAYSFARSTAHSGRLSC